MLVKDFGTGALKSVISVEFTECSCGRCFFPLCFLLSERPFFLQS